MLRGERGGWQQGLESFPRTFESRGDGRTAWAIVSGGTRFTFPPPGEVRLPSHRPRPVGGRAGRELAAIDLFRAVLAQEPGPVFAIRGDHATPAPVAYPGC